jgi:hypothetical protein
MMAHARGRLTRPADYIRLVLNALIRVAALSLLVFGAALALPVLLHPIGAEAVRRAGGLAVAGISILILLVQPPAAMRWPRALVFTLVGFATLQLLDIATTLKGASVGLVEGNRVATALTAPLGSAAGFLTIKIAAVIVLALVMARLPHRLALMTGLGGCGFMAFIVVHNTMLIAG